MIKQNEAVFMRKKKEEKSGVIPDFNRALRLLSIHFDNCLTALSEPPPARTGSPGHRQRFTFAETRKKSVGA